MPGEIPVPYDGAAPEPQTTQMFAQEDQGHVPQPTELRQPTAFAESSPPPVNPELVTQLEEAKRQYGQAVQEIGRLKSEQDARQAQMELQLQMVQMAMAAQQQPQWQPQQPQMPADWDPNQTMTQGDFLAAQQRFAQQLEQALAPRLTLIEAGVTAAEQQAVLTQFPYLQQVREPLRSQQIVAAVNLMRKQQATRSQAQPVAQAPSRPVQKQVPLVEHPENQAGWEPAGPKNALELAQAQYEAALKIRDQQEREDAMRAAMERMARAQGIDPEQYLNISWTNRG